MSVDLILGTAGHIDHGKTALVKALTGVDTDRLPEEKRRGITIDLGFAEMLLGPYRLGIVDVPGHERFVRNMLAGATGIDLALLVVAADDSVKPQTREHLEILRLLGLRAGVIALTKCDLADPAWIDLVEQEVRELVSGTFLAEAPIVRTSVVTGTGMDSLVEALSKGASLAATLAGADRTTGPFRMAIDRAFTVAGHGTVVTGSVVSGRVRLGEELAVEPGGLMVRVRGLENHGRPAEEVHRGQRAAINLAGVHHEQLGRGQELGSPGHLVPSRLLSARLHLSGSAVRPLKNRVRVRLHVGTAELMCGVVLLDRDQISPGDWAPVQLHLASPAVTTWGQAFVIRSESPVVTLGGGQILDPDAPRLRRRQADVLARLADLAGEDPLRRASAALSFAGLRPWQPTSLARMAGVLDGPRVAQTLLEQGDLLQIAVSPTRSVLVPRAVTDQLSERITGLLAKMHAQQPLAADLDRRRLVGRLARGGDEAVIEAVLERMAADRRIRLGERTVALVGHGPQLSDKKRQLLAEIVQRYRDAGFQPPTPAELQAQVTHNQAAVPELLALAAGQGQLVRVSPEFYLHAEWEQKLRQSIAERLAGGLGLTVSQIREILGTSRKYAVPLCEHLDRIGLTRRQGDVRYRGQREEGSGEPGP